VNDANGDESTTEHTERTEDLDDLLSGGRRANSTDGICSGPLGETNHDFMISVNSVASVVNILSI